MTFGAAGVLAAGPSAADWVAAVFTALGGVGAAVGAIFAWRAAAAANETAREVRRAHAAARRPDLRISGVGTDDTRVGVVLRNDGDVDAADIDISVTFDDGTVGLGHADRAVTSEAKVQPWLFVPVQPVPAGIDVQTSEHRFERVSVRFADPERLGRWERVFNVVDQPDPVSPTSPPARVALLDAETSIA